MPPTATPRRGRGAGHKRSARQQQRQGELDRKTKNLTATLTGDTDIMAGMVATIGVGAEMYDGDFSLAKVEHILKKAPLGYETKITAGKGSKAKGSGKGGGGGGKGGK